MCTWPTHVLVLAAESSSGEMADTSCWSASSDSSLSAGCCLCVAISMDMPAPMSICHHAQMPHALRLCMQMLRTLRLGTPAGSSIGSDGGSPQGQDVSDGILDTAFSLDSRMDFSRPMLDRRNSQLFCITEHASEDAAH